MNGRSQFRGWVPDLPDFRDYKYQVPAQLPASPQAAVDMKAIFPAVYYQDTINSCTANAIAGAFEFELSKEKLPPLDPSVLFIYYNQRVLQNSVNVDSGASIRDGLHTMRHQGVCSDAQWPYIIHEFTKKPFESCYKNALKHKIKNYYHLDQDINQMKACLADSHPFVFGFSVYESFFDPQVAHTGTVDLPKKGEDRIFGHAVVAVGYDDQQERFILRNSWGNAWGNQGYFTLPYAYLLDKSLSQNFWTIRLTADTAVQPG